MKSNCYYSEYQCPDHYKQDVDQTEDMKMNGIKKQSQTLLKIALLFLLFNKKHRL